MSIAAATAGLRLRHQQGVAGFNGYCPHRAVSGAALLIAARVASGLRRPLPLHLAENTRH